jgi:pimeloyl-ACP methyl ester carboxylesterase
MAGFRRFAQATGQDLAALAACMRGQTLNEDEDAIRELSLPMLIVCGDKDEALEGARRLALLAPGSEMVVLPGADHMGAVPDQRFKDVVLGWLAKQL